MFFKKYFFMFLLLFKAFFGKYSFSFKIKCQNMAKGMFVKYALKSQFLLSKQWQTK